MAASGPYPITPYSFRPVNDVSRTHSSSAKIIQAAPVDIPDYGSFFQEDDESKEALVRRWEDIITRTGVVMREREEVVDVRSHDEAGFEVEIAGGKSYRTRNVVLAIGMRGTPRRLRVDGETPERVAYNLIDAAEYREQKILVVGGGNAAVEAALALSEPELLQRSRTYSAICARRAAGASTDSSIDPLHRAVFLTNEGNLDEALAILDPILQQNPTAVDPLYVRASVWALRGVADKAVADLRQAILVDPTVRFQAVNDPDFERIREEPAFIDIIEPSPTGA